MAFINQLTAAALKKGVVFQAEVNGKLIDLQYIQPAEEYELGKIYRVEPDINSRWIYCNVEMIGLNHFKWNATGPFGAIIKGRTYFKECMLKELANVPAPSTF